MSLEIYRTEVLVIVDLRRWHHSFHHDADLQYPRLPPAQTIQRGVLMTDYRSIIAKRKRQDFLFNILGIVCTLIGIVTLGALLLTW